MSIDPRLDALHMASGNPTAGLQQRIANIHHRLDALERAATVQVTDGTPGNNDVRDGTLCVASTSLRLYVRVNGAWKFAPLT